MIKFVTGFIMNFFKTPYSILQACAAVYCYQHENALHRFFINSYNTPFVDGN